jgi:hypothetical protein
MSPNQPNDMQALTERTERLISALTSAFMSSAEAAAERFELAARVAQINQRAQAFFNVLEITGAQKEAITVRLANAKGAMKLLLENQLASLDAQEVAILAKLGVEPSVAKMAIAEVDQQPAPSTNGTHRREGKKFVPVNGN